MTLLEKKLFFFPLKIFLRTWEQTSQWKFVFSLVELCPVDYLYYITPLLSFLIKRKKRGEYKFEGPDLLGFFSFYQFDHSGKTTLIVIELLIIGGV